MWITTRTARAPAILLLASVSTVLGRTRASAFSLSNFLLRLGTGRLPGGPGSLRGLVFGGLALALCPGVSPVCAQAVAAKVNTDESRVGAYVLPEALKGLMHSGPHGLSEILYAYVSGTANNGSAFAGLTANAPWWDVTLGVAMACGRFLPIVAVLAIAGALVAKPKLAPTAGAMPTDGGLFVGLLIGVILILGGLQFFPAMALGPIVEHFQVLGAVQALR